MIRAVAIAAALLMPTTLLAQRESTSQLLDRGIAPVIPTRRGTVEQLVVREGQRGGGKQGDDRERDGGEDSVEHFLEIS